MEHVCSSRRNKEDNPLFLDFPSPFFDDISTVPILTNNLGSPNKALNITEPSPSDQSKCLKKRSVGKKDRHSKINTAQGPRDRRMRLSLQIARKFFDLQDLLGFDKASNTVEWLFCKSNKAIKEVAENLNPQQTNQNQNKNTSEEIETMDNSKDEEIMNRELRRQILNSYSVKESRDQARARARDRTRERMMIKELEKSKQLFGGNPKDEIFKLGLELGYLGNPNIHNIEELGYTCSPSEPIQHESRTNHLGLINHNLPAGWINSCNEFLGMPGEWDVDNLLTDYNYGIVPSTSHVTSDIYEQNPSSFFMSTTNNILQFQSPNQGK